jgi:hypothetical protein
VGYSLERGLGLKPVHQDMQKGCPRSSGSLPFGEQPAFEILMVWDRKTIQEFSSKLSGEVEETIGGKSIDAAGKLSSNFEEVDARVLGVKEDVLAVGDDALATGLVHQRTQPG